MFVSPGDRGGRKRVSTSIVQRTIVILTDTQIKKLPSTPIQLIKAPGIGNRIKVFRQTISVIKIAQYSGINSTYAALVTCHIDATNQWLTPAIINDSGYTTPVTQLEKFLGTGAFSVLIDIPGGFMTAINGTASGEQEWVIAGNDNVFSLITQFDNKPALLSIDNNGSPTDLSGGNAGNSMKINTYYTIEPL